MLRPKKTIYWKRQAKKSEEDEDAEDLIKESVDPINVNRLDVRPNLPGPREPGWTRETVSDTSGVQLSVNHREQNRHDHAPTGSNESQHGFWPAA
jgi:hypothetical protein